MSQTEHIAPQITRQSAKAVLVNPQNNTALILRLNKTERERRGIDEWHMPGGVRDDPAEDMPQTACREVAEESGLKARVIRELGKEEWNAYYEGTPAHFEATIFELEVVCDAANAPQAEVSDEHSESAWISSAELGNYPALTKEARKYINLVLEERARA